MLIVIPIQGIIYLALSRGLKFRLKAKTRFNELKPSDSLVSLS